MSLEEAEDYSDLKEIIENCTWQKFERVVGEVFELHNYEVQVSEVRTFENSKRQYDVIATKDHSIIVDCKKWDNKRRIKHALKSAIEDQIERVRKLDGLDKKYPMIVTSSYCPIQFHRNVPVITISKLNKFMSDFQVHKEELLRF